jgi:hypothetical protein
VAEPEGVSVEFESPSAERLRVDWPLDRLRNLEPSGAETVWERAGELDWDEIDAVRVLSGRFEDGRLLAVAAVRPSGAQGHGDDAAFGVLVEGGEPESLAEVLISSEYAADGSLRRIGLELYREQDGLPLRVAGDVTGASRHRDGGVDHEAVVLELRAGGPGAGVLDVLTEA